MKIAKVTAAAAVLAIAVAGCGSGSGQGGSGDESAVKSLTVWRLGDSTPEQTDFMTKINSAFEAKHPGVKVTVQWVAWNDYTKKFQNAVAGGKGPDVTEVGNTDVLGWAKQGALADITGQVQGWAPAKDIPQALFANDDLEGKRYGVPWYAGDRGFLYRKDWFDELKIATPRNWDDIVAAAKRLQQAKGVTGLPLATQADATYFIAPYIWGNGGELATQSGGKWTSGLGSPQAKEAIAFYTGLATKDKVSPVASAGWDSLKTESMFTSGKAGMVMDGSWARPVIEGKNKKLKGKIGSFAIPKKDGSGPAPTFAGGSDLAVWRTTKAPKMAWDYLTLLDSKKNATAFADLTNFFPTFSDVLKSAKYTEDPFLAPFATAMSTVPKTTPATPNWVSANQDKTVVQTMIADIIKGKPLDAEVTKADGQLDDLLNQ
ncbi:MAG TPA: extracellular solute-binding protein [Streptosporangiaceae bacterium]